MSLAHSFHLLPAGTNQFDALVDWIGSVAPAKATVLDIGAGDGDMDYPIRIRPYASRIVGVDPSPGIHDNHLVDERHESTLEEIADQFVATFDVAVAAYVVEHVAEPEGFLRAVATVLKPGGSCFLLTPHAGHYFGAIALATERIGVEEWLLHRIRSHDLLHDHHFPLAYRLNTRKKLMRHAASAGFVSVEVRMIEDPGIFQGYFPAALHGLPRAYSRLVHRLGRPGLAGTMLCRLQRA